MRKKLRFIVMLFVLVLAGCCGCSHKCSHVWEEATCQRRKTCVKCGETVPPYGVHDWIPATCTEPKTCAVCGEKSGDPLYHNISDYHVVKEATCTTDGEMVGVCSRCNETITQTIGAYGHTFKNVVIKEATCVEEGEKELTCVDCGLHEKKTIPVTKHQWGEEVILSEATCTAEGEKELTCVGCGLCEKQTIPMIEHQWGEEVILVEATCEKSGEKERTCTVCNLTEKESIPQTGHDDQGTYYCLNCGNEVPLTLSMNSSEREASLKVHYLSDRRIQHEADNSFTLLFSFKDENEKNMAAPAIIKIRIEDEKGNVVYRAKKIINTYDFGTWSSAAIGERLLGSVEIKDFEIRGAKTASGKIYFSFENDYFAFEESALSIYGDLPKDPITIEMPNLPGTYSYLGYKGKKYTSCRIDEVSYEEGYASMKLLFTGEKTFDYEGPNGDWAVEVYWKIYDEEGYVIDSGSLYVSRLKEGDKFKNEISYVSGLEPGGKYRLELSDYS